MESRRTPIAEAADDAIVLQEAPRPDTLGSVAYEAIREAIVNRALPPGRRLIEVELARQLKVSKTPVREALLRLRQVGLIEDDGSRGGRVIRPSVRRLRDAYQVREALETFTARAAAEQASDEQRQAIQVAAGESMECAAASDLDHFRHWDHEFHMAIAMATDNAQIQRLLDDALALVTAIVQRDIPQLETSVDAGRSHVRIAKAIAAREQEKASVEMREHLGRARAHTVERLARTPGNAVANNATDGSSDQ